MSPTPEHFADHYDSHVVDDECLAAERAAHRRFQPLPADEQLAAAIETGIESTWPKLATSPAVADALCDYAIAEIQTIVEAAEGERTDQVDRAVVTAVWCALERYARWELYSELKRFADDCTALELSRAEDPDLSPWLTA